LEPEEKEAQIRKWQTEKNNRPARESTCTVFPTVQETVTEPGAISRAAWISKIRAKNPWLAEAG
jgi:hypothetical protein